MDKKNKVLLTFRYIIIIVAFFILILNIKAANVSDVKNLVISIIFLIPCILMSIFVISIGDTLRIELSDTMVAFVFAIYGRNVGTLFMTIAWLLGNTISEKVITKRNENLMIIFNTGMFIITSFFTTSIINFVLAFLNNSKILLYIMNSIGFIGVFLLINITIMWMDFSLSERKCHRFQRKSINLMLVNFLISSIATLTMFVVYDNSGIVGSILIVSILLILHYCFHIYRKLKVRNDAINRLLKITGDIVRYGDFREKCKHLINNLNNLIPYNICSIYTFDVEAGGVVFPIAYNAPEDIDIGEVTFNISSNGITIKTIKEGKIYISRDIKRDKRVKFSGKIGEVISAVVMVPFLIEDKVVGMIMIGGDEKLINFATTGIDDLLQILSNQMALAIENDGIYRDMKNKVDIDPLTKLYNRRVLDREIQSLINTNTPFSIVMYDIDDFKKVNDNYGHLVGDEILREIADIIKKSIRKTDVPCRYGGEEMVIIFKDLKKDDAYIISERIRKNIELTSTLCSGGQVFVTVSGGVSSYPEDGKTKDEVINIADEILYTQCKRKGKNRVCASRIISEGNNLLDHA